MINELRLGNWVQSGERFCRVSAIYRSHFRCEYADGIVLDTSVQLRYEPIPLSPSILEKCGFVRSGESYMGAEVWYNMFVQVLMEGEAYKGVMVYGHPVAPQRGMYLHLFMNFFYFNTGQELSINL